MSELKTSKPEELLHFAHADEWWAFLNQELAASVAAYVAKPALLRRDFNDERQVSDDYAGRELLELVQNAADAASENGGNGRVLIEVTKWGLFVANTGQPFRPSGVSSLMTAHLSDKPQRKRGLIGAKGLGFRAILNWSREPFISSGTLELAFSKSHSEAAVNKLGAEHSNVSKYLAGRQTQPAPILPFPLFGTDMKGLEGTDHGARLVAHARSLRAAGYDTVIASPFYSDSVFKNAVEQTSEFEPRFLLFVRALSEIDIRVEGQEARIWKKVIANDDDDVELQIFTGDSHQTESWICRYADGELSDDPERSPDQPSRYELAVALRTDSENERGSLHCYFPTSVPVPFSALFHATLEITSNRKSLKDQSNQNDEVLSKFATFYAETLSALRDTGVVLNALDFLYPDETFPEPLKRFEEQVYQAAAQQPIIETISGEHVCAAQTRLGPRGYDKFFPERLFPDLARVTSPSDSEVLHSLGVATMEPGEAVDILRQANLELDERAAVIAGLALNLPGNFHHRSFLIDGKDRPLKPRNSCFPPPTSGRPPVLPSWASAKFISGPLWERLSALIPGAPREKILRLKSFGVEEYNLDGVVRSLVRQAERLIARRPDLGLRVRGELLSALARLHDREGETIPKFPPLVVLACAKDGAWRPLRELHISENYGPVGRINEALYSSRPDLLLGSLAQQNMADPPANPAAFFQWMSAHQWPRVEEITEGTATWQLIHAQLPTEFEVFDDRGTPQFVNRSELLLAYSVRFKAEGIAGLQDILTTAGSDAIIAWLARDPRFDPATGRQFTCSLEARKNANANFRAYRGDLPDLVRLRLRTTKWLECVDGERRAPSEAMRDPGRLVGLFVRPRPANDITADYLSLDQMIWARGLANASVPATLQDLSEPEIYQLLLSLQERRCEPDLVRRFYLHILELDDFRAARGGANGDLFKQTGSIQVRRGRAVEWLTPGSAFYVDRDGIPASVKEHLPLIDLPTRRGAKQVSERFGVHPLGRQDFSIEIAAHTVAPEPDRSLLIHRFAQCKKFVRALRSAVSSDTTSLRRLERIRLAPATEVKLNIRRQEQDFVGELETWAHLLDGDDLYVTVDPAMEPAKLFQLSASAVGDGLAELFEVQNGADFATMFALGDDASRRIMLGKFLPNFSNEELEGLFGEIEDPGPPAPPRFDPSRLAAPAGTGKEDSNEVAPSDEPPLPPPPPGEDPNSVDAHAVEHDASRIRTSRRTALRVSRGSGSLGRGPRDPTKTGDAEKWAALFETQQGRHPLAVAHLQGEDAFGCDVLSFLTASDLEQFKESLDEGIVDRFIEVKSGGVRLTTNEVRAAERYAERYFVYRVMFDADGRKTATLTAVSDPLSRQAALATELTMDLNAVSDRQVFKVIRGDAEDADGEEE